MKHLLIAVDFTPGTPLIVKTAREIASAFGSTVRLLHVAPPDPAFAHSRSWPQEVRDELAKELKHEHAELQKIADDLEKEGIPAKFVLARGPIAETIVSYANEADVDLLILGSHKDSTVTHYLPHNVMKGVLKKCPCPVLIIPAIHQALSESRSR